jgi:hypothetical protein
MGVVATSGRSAAALIKLLLSMAAVSFTKSAGVPLVRVVQPGVEQGRRMPRGELVGLPAVVDAKDMEDVRSMAMVHPAG